MSTFREPTGAVPSFISVWSDVIALSDTDVPGTANYNVAEYEVLLEVLLDICPNAEALANNWLLEEQKREYMKGGREP